jgi:hypothetical protein
MSIENTLLESSFGDKGKTNINSVKNNTEKSLMYIVDKYKNDELLNESIRFCDFLFIDSFRADIDTLKRIGFYPNTEADYELEFTIKELLSGNYKSSVDHMRRALELTILAIYFSLDDTDFSKAREWMESAEDTPSFSGKMIKSLIKQDRFKEIDSLHNWSEDIKNHYWKLCDYVHVRGMKKGYRNLNLGSISATCGNRILPINEKTIDVFLKLYIETIQHILVSLYLYNPILLKGVPIDEKFGTNPPIGGYFNETQAELMRKLIPDKYATFLNGLISTDEEIISTSDYFSKLPDAMF